MKRDREAAAALGVSVPSSIRRRLLVGAGSWTAALAVVFWWPDNPWAEYAYLPLVPLALAVRFALARRLGRADAWAARLMGYVGLVCCVLLVITPVPYAFLIVYLLATVRGTFLLAFAVIGTAGLLSGAKAARAWQGAAGLIARVDHLVYATPDLDAGIGRVEALLGVRATPGGQHPGAGTRNALVALGPSCYLEIIGPDPEQPKPAGPRRFGIDDLTAPRLATWAAKGSNLEQILKDAEARGISLGAVTPGSRRRPDGVLLAWRFTSPATVLGDGLVPFFIDWGTSPHPSSTAATGATLVSLRAEHPDPDRVRSMLRAFAIDLEVARGQAPALIATIDGPKGRVEVRE